MSRLPRTPRSSKPLARFDPEPASLAGPSIEGPTGAFRRPLFC